MMLAHSQAELHVAFVTLRGKLIRHPELRLIRRDSYIVRADAGRLAGIAAFAAQRIGASDRSWQRAGLPSAGHEGHRLPAKVVRGLEEAGRDFEVRGRWLHEGEALIASVWNRLAI